MNKILVANINPISLQGDENHPQVAIVRKGKLGQLSRLPENTVRIIILKPDTEEVAHLKRLTGNEIPVLFADNIPQLRRQLSKHLVPASDAPADGRKKIKAGTRARRRGPRINPMRDFVRDNLWRVEGKNNSEAARVLAELGQVQGLSDKAGSYCPYVRTLRERPEEPSGIIAIGGETAAAAEQIMHGVRGILSSCGTELARLEKSLQTLAAENEALRLGNQVLQSRIETAETERKELASLRIDNDRLRERLKKMLADL